MSKDKDAEIPSVRELEAREEKDRKETEELLSGFDRPLRTPRTPRARDFVDYYASPSAKAAARAPAARREETSPHEKPTVIVPRRSGMRTTITWALAVSGMILFGAMIAVLVTPPAAVPQAIPIVPSMVPSSATTVTSAEPAPPETAEETAADTVIVAPPPNAANAPSAPSAPAKKGATTSAIGAGSLPTLKTAPRNDFIRDM